MLENFGILLIDRGLGRLATNIAVAESSFLRKCLCLVIPLIFLCGSVTSAAEPKSLNALLSSVLSKHIDDGYVDFPAIAKNPRFRKYLESLGRANKSIHHRENEHMAFWINVYNAMAIKNVIEGGSTLSPVGRVAFFRLNQHRVGGRNFSLNDVKDVIVSYEDPRSHFAMSDSTYSAPSVLSEAYRKVNLDEQLERAAVNFLNDKRKNRFSRNLLEAKISPIFEINLEHFGNDERLMLEFVAKFVRDEGIARDLRAGQYSAKYMKYDWTVNGRPLD